MISLVSSFLNHCFPTYSYQPISAPAKKDDELGKDAINIWIATHPMSKDMASWETKKINAYVHQLFRDLPSSPICEESQVEAKTHIIKIANHCERAYLAALNEWENAKLDADFKKCIGSSLVYCTPQLT